MIDSINFIIRNVEYLEFQQFQDNKITYKKFKNNTKTFQSIGYSFKYQGIEFKYYKSFNIILVIANAHKVLEKRNITLSDLTEYKIKLNRDIKIALNINDVKLELNRIDYYVDLQLNDQIETYLKLMKYHKDCYKYMKIKRDYTTSNYLKTETGQTNLNIYSRFECTKDEKDKGILRIEVQNKKWKIKREYDKYGITKDISNYWSKEAMQEYYFDFLENYLYERKIYEKSSVKTNYRTVRIQTYNKGKVKEINGRY